MKNTTKLNETGAAHYAVLAVIIIGIAIVGTYWLVTSHADTVLPKTDATVSPAASAHPNIVPKSDATGSLRDTIVGTMVSQLGIKEVPNGSNKIPGNPYHSNPKAWCAYFTSWVWQKAGVKDTKGKSFPRLANANSIKKWGISNKHWHKLKSNYVPKPGDAVIFTNGVHVAEVAEVKNGNIEIIGGNYHNKVAYQTSTNGKYLDAPSKFAVKEDDGSIHHIAGFVSPN